MDWVFPSWDNIGVIKKRQNSFPFCTVLMGFGKE